VGRTGVITPLANLKSVEIDGSVVSKATLHNIAEIERLGIGRGDLVMLVKAGDIIPKIISVLEHKGQPIQIPAKCPSCGSDLINDKIKLFCPSDECPRKQFNRILNWIKVMKIDQFGEALAAKLNDIGKLNCILDLYKLKEEDISSLEGWGESSADKILDNINKSRQASAEILLTAIGIPSISEGTSEELLKVYGSIDKLFQVSVDELKQIKGFSDISANTVVKGLKKYEKEIKGILEIISLSSKGSVQGLSLTGLSFCFTGTMSQPRSFFQALVTQNGGKNSSSVTKDLSYLVCNEDKGSSKSIKAQKFGVKVITESDFLGLIKLNTFPEKDQITAFTIFD
jgi:DNA ligase (NAD+)